MTVALIGSYDGSGNFGDIAQLDAAVSLVRTLGVEPVVVVERLHLASHRELRPDLDALAYEPDVRLARDGVTAVYLYGGGYLNASWGARKLAMARAVLDGAPDAVCISSGLQAQPEWIASLSAADHELLARFAPFGVRDALSGRALAALGPTEATGDDAVAVLPAASGAERAERVNVHVAEHRWVTDAPAAVAPRWLEALDELEGRPVIQPLVAYLDHVTSELPGLQRFAGAARERGYEIAEPIVLRPEALAEAAPVIASAQLTLSCSYHVALASLMLGVPVRLAEDNAYYEQKSAGLAADFTGPESPARVRARRARAEATLTARLAAGLLAASRERVRGHAAQAVALRAELAHLRLELQAYERQGTDPWIPADARLAVEQAQAATTAAREARALEVARRHELEARVADLERQLSVVYGSRSWKLTAPLRATRPPRRGSTL